MADSPESPAVDVRRQHVNQSRRLLPGPGYYAALAWLHRLCRPASYVEIGVNDGGSLSLAVPETLCIGIDPLPRTDKPLPPKVRLFEMTSDDFFERYDLADVLGAPSFSMAFIDGLHLFEQALRDFVNLERTSGHDSLVVLHDCLPLDAATSARTRTTEFYSGDTWKLPLCLAEARPDLRMTVIPALPTGLCLVSGLDRSSTVLEREFDAIVSRYIGLDYDDYLMRRSQMPPSIPNTRAAISAHVTSLMRELRGRAPLDPQGS